MVQCLPINRDHRCAAAWSMVLALACLSVPVSADRPLGPIVPAAVGTIDMPNYLDPKLTGPSTKYFFKRRYKELWLLALDRPDVDTRRRTALAFAQAHGDGMTGLDDIPQLLTDRLNTETHPTVVWSLARALDQFDHKAAADAMLKRSEQQRKSPGLGVNMVLIVDPPLARWDHRPARAEWRKRIENRDSVPRTIVWSAIQSLAAVRDEAATELLLACLTDAGVDSALRIHAARALGQIARSGLDQRAGELASSSSVLDHLIAAEILTSHTDAAAVGLLRDKALDDGEDPVVVAAALRILNTIDKSIVSAMVDPLVTDPDPNIRHQIVISVAAQRSIDAARTLAGLLDDPSVAVRTLARDTLVDYHSDKALRPVVHKKATEVLTTDRWRGVEQAALVLGKVDHEPVADRLIELMNHLRPEVRLAACYALRELSIPQTLPAILAQTERLTGLVKRFVKPDDGSHGYLDPMQVIKDLQSGIQLPDGLAVAVPDTVLKRIDEETFEQITESEKTAIRNAVMDRYADRGRETAQLMMAMAAMRYEQAKLLMHDYIPKHSGFDAEARAAAIYALGLMHEGKPDDTLITLLEGRLADINPFNPETIPVRRFSAIGLGRMGDPRALETLKQFYEAENGTASIGGSCRWSIIRITGEDPGELKTLESWLSGYFLEPTDPM